MKNNQSILYNISDDQANQRLDVFLTDKLPGLSRNQAQKKIKKSQALVNGKPATSHYRLKKNDSIKFIIESKNHLLQATDKSPLKSLKNVLKKIIIEDANDYLVINKPAGLIVHGADHIEEMTLADWLLEKYPKIKKIGESPERPGIVHRLDKEASGLMVIAKTQIFFNKIKEQFVNRKINKEYTALVFGQINRDEGEICFPIKRSVDGYKMAACPPQTKISREGQVVRQAKTEFKVIKKFINYSLIKVRIKTGRTHQIRVHMLAYGHPIVGDNLYGTKKTKEKNKKIALDRIFLVADKLSFHDSKNVLREFKISLPPNLKKILKEKIK